MFAPTVIASVVSVRLLAPIVMVPPEPVVMPDAVNVVAAPNVNALL